MKKELVAETNIIGKDNKKLRAAYALNLCTVSVSQIVDYDDLNIMEQEYEAILNNLNIEEMPKDESLLNILKQMLDTITFFRIQEGDKKFIEREYQQKMKNAIWSAVPNFGVIVAGGLNPVSLGISLASQIGIGYMNYRKEKAAISLEREKQEWQLQRSAMEQFNGLRRELFDTAWRLADKYGFPDSYRLTEKQIRQYDEILMDSDNVRRYERLYAIRNNFKAYPPFWYQLAHTANAISIEYNEPENEDEQIIRDQYRQLAKAYFEQYDAIDIPLLREDVLAASCDLEYAGLLDAKTDSAKIKHLLDNALRRAGKEFDVLQLCAIEYARINDYDSCEHILRQLVNEKYNEIVNAQLLSRIYISKYLLNEHNAEMQKEYKANYTLLSERISSSRYLFPFPQGESQEELEAQFVWTQKDVLTEKVRLVVEEFFEKFCIRFNKVIPNPDFAKDYPDSYYLDTASAIDERKNQMSMVLSNKKKAGEYTDRLREVDLGLEYLSVLNSMLCELKKLQYFDVNNELENIKAKITAKKDAISDVQARLDCEFGFAQETSSVLKSDIDKLFSISFEDFTEELKEKSLKPTLNGCIDSLCSIESVSDFDNAIRTWCISVGIQEPDILFNESYKRDENAEETFLPAELLGTEVKIAKEEKKQRRNAIDKIKPYKDKLAKNKNGIEFICKERGNELDRYFANKKLEENIRNRKKEIVAVLRDTKASKRDLLFTKNEVILLEGYKQKSSSNYSDVLWNDNATALRIGKREYQLAAVNLNMLYDLLNELR